MKRKSSLLVTNWRRVMKRSWSIWLILLAGVLSAMEAMLSELPAALELEQGTYAMLSVGIAAAAWIARLLVQESLHPKEKPEDAP